MPEPKAEPLPVRGRPARVDPKAVVASLVPSPAGTLTVRLESDADPAFWLEVDVPAAAHPLAADLVEAVYPGGLDPGALYPAGVLDDVVGVMARHGLAAAAAPALPPPGPAVPAAAVALAAEWYAANAGRAARVHLVPPRPDPGRVGVFVVSRTEAYDFELGRAAAALATALCDAGVAADVRHMPPVADPRSFFDPAAAVTLSDPATPAEGQTDV